MILKSLHLENFKGAKDKIYKFGKTTRVSGMNRLGKTTIATAWFWLLADKNYELVSNLRLRQFWMLTVKKSPLPRCRNARSVSRTQTGSLR